VKGLSPGGSLLVWTRSRRATDHDLWLLIGDFPKIPAIPHLRVTTRRPGTSKPPVQQGQLRVVDTEDFKMKHKLAMFFALAISLCTISMSLFAHHGNASYESDKTITVLGNVTEWLWANPHCFLKVDVKDDKGELTHWVVETSNPQDMARQGWARDSFKAGDEITITLIQAKNGRPIGRFAGKSLLLDRKPFPPIASNGSGTTPTQAKPQ
jgi:hypothetical protein